MIARALLLWLALTCVAQAQDFDPEKHLYHYLATVESVYDGDTITIHIKLGFDLSLDNQKIRLFGINTPELRGKGVTDAEKKRGIRARDWLSERILGNEIIIQTIKDTKGKFGRWLGIIWLDGVNLNELLVERGYAVTAEY